MIIIQPASMRYHRYLGPMEEYILLPQPESSYEEGFGSLAVISHSFPPPGMRFPWHSRRGFAAAVGRICGNNLQSAIGHNYNWGLKLLSK